MMLVFCLPTIILQDLGVLDISDFLALLPTIVICLCAAMAVIWSIITGHTLFVFKK